LNIAARSQIHADCWHTSPTNVLGYYLVTTGMLDSLMAAPQSHVVNVASTFASDVDLEDLQFERRPYDAMSAYAQSKACDRMLTWAFARRLQGLPVSVNAMAPGLVLGTSLYRQLTPEAKRGLERYGSRGISVGAETAVWLAGSADLDGVSSRFFDQSAEIPCQFRNTDVEEPSGKHAKGWSGIVQRPQTPPQVRTRPERSRRGDEARDPNHDQA
jgi:hypothetical protein